jgi:hypothetical protein
MSWADERSCEQGEQGEGEVGGRFHEWGWEWVERGRRRGVRICVRVAVVSSGVFDRYDGMGLGFEDGISISFSSRFGWRDCGFWPDFGQDSVLRKGGCLAGGLPFGAD